MNKKPLVIDYYTDVLCVWAWIAQRRVEELNAELGDRVSLRYFYVDIFGNVPNKMHFQWQDRGGFEAFRDHVLGSAKDYQDAPINPAIWDTVRPFTSANAHLILKAIAIAYGEQKSIDCALLLRKAFFVDAVDVGKLDALYTVLENSNLAIAPLEQCINSGEAIAALMNDYQMAKQLSIKGSPTFVIDGGRQTLYGNVGYRVLRANIEELLKNPTDEASWC